MIKTKFPISRMRRLRKTPLIRSLVKETQLSINDLIYPIFVKEGINKPEPINAMPGQYRLSLDDLIKECEQIISLGIPAIILFSIPLTKDSEGSSASDPNGIVQLAVKLIKQKFGDKLLVITDLCLCQFTDHGHCGIIQDNQI